ncbi:MAG: NACHT domain-containing protein [Candidatus Hodarchaeota archaeon]
MPGEIIAGLAIAKTFEWVWKNFGKDIIKSSAKHLKAPWERFEIRQAAKRYAEDMKRLYGVINIFAMTTPIPLEGIFTQVHILSKPSAFRRLSKEYQEHLEKIFLEGASFGDIIEPRKDGITIVRKYPRLFILGKPGAGKTTFLKYLVLQAINGTLDTKRNLIPIFLSLREFIASKQILIDFITQQFGICGFPHAEPFIKQILEQGKALVLFDGLDEVNKEEGQRDRVIRLIKSFSNRYNKCQMVVTCRIAATEYHFEHFSYVEMADFEEKQISTFVQNWFKYSPNVETHLQGSPKEHTEQFFSEFRKNSRLYDLAKTPLILTLLCIAFEEALEFSDSRSEIYDEAFNALLKKWDVSRGIKRDTIYSKLTPARKQQMFAAIAAESFEQGQYLFKLNELKRLVEKYFQKLPSMDKYNVVDGIAIIKSIEAQHGIFVERSQDVYSFSHLTFQEYFTAKYIVEHSQQGTLIGLIHTHCTNNQWREVFLLVAEMLADADMFFEAFLTYLNEMIKKNKRLNRFLIKIEDEATNTLIPKAIICNNELKISQTIARAFNRSLSIDLERAFDIASRFHHDTFYSRHAVDPNLTLEDEEVRVIAFAQALFFTYNRTGDSLRAREYARKLHDYFIRVLGKTKGKARLYPNLYKDLIELFLPKEKASSQEWIEFINELLKLFNQYRPIEDYIWTKEDVEYLKNYLTAAKLLLDCLKIAVVSSRDAIENLVLHSPSKVSA